jgi:hypothetical protein
MEWQTIDTAPIGKRFLACVPIKQVRLYICTRTKDELILDENGQPMYYRPSWWMPLPERPEF